MTAGATTTSRPETLPNRRVIARARLFADQVEVKCQIRVVEMAGGNEA